MPGKIPEIEDLFLLAQEAGRFGVFEWQVQSGALRLSPKLFALYGLTTFGETYDAWIGCVFREDQQRVAHDFESAFEQGLNAVEFEFRVVRPSDGALVWIEARNLIFYDAAGAALRVVGVNVDTTERKRAHVQLRAFTETLEEAVRERTRELEEQNEARKKAEELLRQAQKMEAVGQLTGGIAHDFNNLLTIVMGGLDSISRQLRHLPESAATARIARSVDLSLQGVRRGATLTNRLLAFSRQQPLQPTAIDLNKLVPSICELFRRSIGEAISLETVLAGGLWQTSADTNQLENALLNLAVNARDAMPDGGKLTIECQNCHLDDKYVLSVPEPMKPGQYVMIAVADTGTGMEKAILEHVFEPFFTTKEVGKGTGLGLSQVYGFVRQSGGHIRIYSELGEGTTVKIYLPRFTGDSEAEGIAQDREAAPRAAGQELILVVEDDDGLRAHTTEILRELGYSVIEAASGAAALKVIGKRQAIDLLFTDIVMPGGMNGRQLADEAVRVRPRLKVLFTTGYTRNAIVHHGRLDPGVEMISKPFSFDALARKVRAVLDRVEAQKV